MKILIFICAATGFFIGYSSENTHKEKVKKGWFYLAGGLFVGLLIWISSLVIR